MRKVVAYTLVSVDGVAEDPETFLFDFDEAMEANLAEVIADAGHRPARSQDVRRVVDYWPKSDDQPFADFINTVQKYVATATPLTNEWTNAEAHPGSGRRTSCAS